MDYYIIEGITEEGDRFRPSDWAERLAASAALFSTDKRLRFVEYLIPIIVNGSKALRVDCQLEQLQPMLWDDIISFAAMHQLRSYYVRESLAACS